MKKVLMLAVMVLGTSAMMNAQTDAKTPVKHEVKHMNHHKKRVSKADSAKEMKMEATETKKAK